MISRFECGCIGIVNEQSKSIILIIEKCTDDYIGLQFKLLTDRTYSYRHREGLSSKHYYDDLMLKKRTYLSVSEQVAVIEKINNLIADGESFRTIKTLMNS